MTMVRTRIQSTLVRIGFATLLILGALPALPALMALQPATPAEAAPTASEVSTTVVISQIYPSGGQRAAGVIGSTDAPYTHDYIELHNLSAVPQSLANMSIQTATNGSTPNDFDCSNPAGCPTANDATVDFLPSVSIPAGGYFLIEGGGNLTACGGVPCGGPLPVTADLVAPSAFDRAAGRAIIALVDHSRTGAPPTSNPPDPTISGLPCGGGLVGAAGIGQDCFGGATAMPIPGIVDFVGWGTPAGEPQNCAGGGATCTTTAVSPSTSNTDQAAYRLTNARGCQDTGDNLADFDKRTAVPRNSASPVFLSPCLPQTPVPTVTLLPTFTRTPTVTRTPTLTPAVTATNTSVPATATHTPVPAPTTPTATRTTPPVPPTATNTSVAATNTPAPPTATRTNTPVPPTATNTAVPPTATSTPGGATPTPTPTPTGKVLMCHNGHTISIANDPDAIAAHQRMGDTFGACPGDTALP